MNNNFCSAARLIGRVSKFYHISAYMQDVLHYWLPLRQRIEFRVAVLVWYSLICQASAYLTDLCRPSPALRAPVTFARLSRASFMSHLLVPPPCRAGPSPWLAHWLSGHFLEYSLRNSFSNLKQNYPAVLGLGALLSRPT